MKLKQKDMDLSTVFQNGECPDCGADLFGFDYNPDPDGGSYNVTCDECGERHYIVVSKVKLFR
jgi:ribosomal protein S27E